MVHDYVLTKRDKPKERAKVRNAMEQTLSATAMKLVTCVNAHKDHIPPITTSEANPFPYQIYVNSQGGEKTAGGGDDGAPGSSSSAAAGAAAGASAGAATGWTARMGIY